MTGDDDADVDGGQIRSAKARVDLSGPGADQAVARHGVEHPGLPQEHDQHHRAQPEHRAQGDERPEPGKLADPLDRIGHGMGHVELGVVHQTRERERHKHVQDGADDQRPQNADRHVPLRVLGLLRRGADRIEPDVGEENQPRTPEHPAPAETPRRCPVLGGMNGFQLSGIHVLQSENDDQQYHRHLQDDDQVVDLGRFLDADDEDGRGDQHDERRREVEEGAGLVPAHLDAGGDSRW